MTEQVPPSPPQPLSPAEEKQWAMFSHLGVLVNLFTGFLGVAVPLIIYFIYKDRSRYVAYHSMQALVMQGICSFGGFLVAALISALSFIPGIGLICLPISCIFWILPVVGFFYGIYGAIQVNQGREFNYWLVGDWVRNSILK